MSENLRIFLYVLFGALGLVMTVGRVQEGSIGRAILPAIVAISCAYGLYTIYGRPDGAE